MLESVDTLVVGARCAGAPLALSLARAGQNVLLVDAAKLPSDQPMSTHFIQPFGMRILDELGLGDAVRDVAPPISRFFSGVGDAVVRFEFDPDARACCPRRTELDALLLEAARASGARTETGTRLIELLRKNDRVVGAVLEAAGQKREVHARIVVGADGPHSTVATLAGAKEYYGYDSPRATYWAYWQRPSDYASNSDYGGAAALLHQGNDFFLVFPANRDQLLVGVSVPIETLPEWRGNHRERLFEKLRSFAFTAPLVQEEPISKVIGWVKARFFFREAAGPGWALVGDAGLFKDPAPGLGISDALRDSQALCRAIIQGGDEALEKYWRQRDLDSLDLFEYARDTGTPGYHNALNHVLYRKISKDPMLRAHVARMFVREIEPSQLVSTAQVIRWTLGALLQGNFGVIKPFFAAGEKGAHLKKELEIRTALLKALS